MIVIKSAHPYTIHHLQCERWYHGHAPQVVARWQHRTRKLLQFNNLRHNHHEFGESPIDTQSRNSIMNATTMRSETTKQTRRRNKRDDASLIFDNTTREFIAQCNMLHACLLNTT